MEISGNESNQIEKMMKKSILKKDGNPARYHLQTTDILDQSEPYRKITVGERDTKKPHKIILMVGETGSGKTTLINTMINYICGVQRKDNVWFEITDDQSDRSSAHSQTSDVTVYGVYIQETSVDLTIIDTPGYGNTQNISLDQKIAKDLFNFCTSDVHKIDAVCLINNTPQSRLSDRQHYIFDSVQSLFGRDIGDNIVLLFTHSDGLPPKNALTAIKEAEVKCAVDEKKNQPIYFLFNNCQGETFLDEECDQMLEQAWNLSYKGMERFFEFLNNIKTKDLKLTQGVLQKRQQLQKKMSNLHSCIEKIAQNDKQQEENKNFKQEVEESYKEKVDIDPAKASRATCCTVCEENCHYPGCGWFCYPLGCSMMENDQCMKCRNKCHQSKHVREAKIYETKTKTETKIDDAKKQNFDKLEKELQELEKEKIKRVMDVFHCVESLEMMALQTDPLFILEYIDFLIEKLKEIKEPEKAEALENIKKRKR